jgi:hypothetical protein
VRICLFIRLFPTSLDTPKAFDPLRDKNPALGRGLILGPIIINFQDSFHIGNETFDRSFFNLAIRSLVNIFLTDLLIKAPFAI